MVIRAEDVEEIVVNDEVPDGGGAGEVHHERHALDLGALRLDEALSRLAAPPLIGEPQSVAEVAEQPVTAIRATGPGTRQLLGHRGREGRGGEGQAVAYGVPADDDGRIASAAPGMGERGRHGAVTPSATNSHSRPTKTGRR